VCAHYEHVPAPDWFPRYFGAKPPESFGKLDLWPGYLGSFVRLAVTGKSRPQAARFELIDVEPGDVQQVDVEPAQGDLTEFEAVNGVFGLVPHWAADLKRARSTYNARSETVATKPSFRDAWRKGRHCIIPARAIYEPDWRSGKAIATRIERADGRPLGIAGLWDTWKNPDGSWLCSYTMLTINADTHPLMQNFHKPADEKRMVVILPESSYGDWLRAPAAGSSAFLTQFPADELVARDDPVSARSG